MDDETITSTAAAAREELRTELDPRPPEFGEFERRSRTRRRRLAGVVIVMLLATGTLAWSVFDAEEGTGVVAGPQPSDTEPASPKPSVSIGGTTVPDDSNAALLAPGESRALAESPLSGRSTMASVWTGAEMFIWGGDSEAGQFDDGATYDPRNDTWELLPDSPLSARNAPAGVWTGEEILLWGGSSSSGEPPDPGAELGEQAPRSPEEAERLGGSIDHRDGAAYNPSTATWRRIAPGPFESAGRPIGLWNGSEMIVLAGLNSSDVAAYDPVADSWRKLPDLPGQLQVPNPVAVWAGTRIATVVKGTGTDLFPTTELIALNPDDESWSTIAQLISPEEANEWIDNPTLTSEPDSISWMSEFGTGEMALAWTGDGLVVASDTRAVELRDGQQRPIAEAPANWQPGDTPSVWTGEQLILWTGAMASAVDPTASTWRLIPSGETGLRIQPTVVWADGVLLTWGGFPNLSAGVMVRPPE